MELDYSKRFIKQVKDLPPFTQSAVKVLVQHLSAARDLSELPNLKKLHGSGPFYRIRIGDYRIGFELTKDNKVIFLAAAHRKDIYKLFP